MRVVPFAHTRQRRGWLIWNDWFAFRFYPPVLPTWTFWRKR